MGICPYRRRRGCRVTPETLLEWVSNQGFALAFAAFFLLRLDQKLDKIILILEKNAEK